MRPRLGRNGEDESGSLTLGGFEPNRAAVLFDDLLCNRQAQAGTTMRRAGGSKVWLEYLIPVSGGNSWPSVRYGEPNVIVVNFRSHRNLPSFRREFQGIVD